MADEHVVYKQVSGDALEDETRNGWELVRVLAAPFSVEVPQQQPHPNAGQSYQDGYGSTYVNPETLMVTRYERVIEPVYLLRRTEILDRVEELEKKLSQALADRDTAVDARNTAESVRERYAQETRDALDTIEAKRKSLVDAEQERDQLRQALATLRVQLGKERYESLLAADVSEDERELTKRFVERRGG